MRRRRAPKREVQPDLKYNSKLVGKFINMIMRNGKKSVAEKIVYNSFKIIEERIKDVPDAEKSGKPKCLLIFQKAVENVRPLLEVRPRRVGGATYQVPMEVKQERGITLALRWMRDFARARKGKPMEEKIAEEIISAYHKQGPAIKKRENLHKMAEANRAFAHFRW
ncbi:MAG: 30S ribosomal protein S7 [Candidatus Omnitrophota bacterium]|nr:MAG: 30S ribosomal protein S7 [Candidatus Omnitrophota bacterium]